MKTFRIVILMAFCLSGLRVHSQDVLEQINAVKLDPEYVWGEATHEIADSAYEAALEELNLAISSRIQRELDHRDLRKHARRLQRPRGQRIRVLAYIKLSDVMKDAAPVTPPSTSSTKPTINVSVATPSQTPPPPPPPPAIPATSGKLGTLVGELMATNDLKAALLLLDERKSSGDIASWSPYSKTSHPEGMYLLIYDREYNIPLAILSPENASGMRRNLSNNTEESLSSYQDKQAVCFSLNKK